MVLGNPYSVCILFRVHHCIFLISDQNVSDIIPLPEIKRTIPNTPAYIAGICNSYNRCITMVDLKILLNLTSTKAEDTSPYVVVISDKSRKIGLLADKIISVEPSYEFLQTDKNLFVSNFISNIYVMKKTNEFALELDIPKILSMSTHLCDSIA